MATRKKKDPFKEWYKLILYSNNEILKYCMFKWNKKHLIPIVGYTLPM